MESKTIRIEIADSAQTTLIALAIILCIGGIAFTAIWNSFRENRLYIEHGYTQASLPGFSDTRWIKGDSNGK
jgi:hypothetical protein